MARARALPLDAPAASDAPVCVSRPRLPEADTILPYLKEIDEARWYSNFGPLVTRLEQRLSGRFSAGTEVVTAVNATQAISLGLRAMGLPPGGHVVLPAWTFVATAHAVLQAGLKPWFVDVDAETWMLDCVQVADLAKRRPGEIAAVVPVCAFGRVPDLEAWNAFRAETGVPVLIDAAAAFDTLHDARLPAVVSLHATKVLGMGEGGFLATEDADYALRLRQLTTFGFNGSRESMVAATNAKISEYGAAVGLAALDAWPADRLRFLRTAQMMRIALMNLPKVDFQDGWGMDWVTSVCSVRLPEGSALAAAQALAAKQIDTRRWWGDGCHRSPAFAGCRREALPVTDRLASSTLGLPFSIDMDIAEISRLADALRDIVDAR